MNKSTKVLIGMIIVTIILFVLNQVISNKPKVTNKDANITINSEQMPSIYNKLGEKTITKISEGNDKTGKYIEIVYSDIALTELADYITELGNLNYALTSSSDNSAILAKESSSKGKILTISITYSKNDTTIKYARGTGTLTRS